MRARDFDLVLFGASGFAAGKMAEVLHAWRSGGGALRWALAGRDPARLAAVRDALGAGEALPLLWADARDAAALARLAARTRAILSTVGPYQLHGEPLVTACAHAGTDYVDLCGEPLWMARMIRQLQAPAQSSGARIVFSCGFDSIPFDLGVVFLQHAARERLGAPLAEVHATVRAMKGGFSGGTAASLLATMEAVARDPALARTLDDPFALTPGFRGPPQPDGDAAAWDELVGCWSGPFVMAPINTKNVHRSNALRGHPWGRDFRYVERMGTGAGAAGRAGALALARASRWQRRLLAVAPTRALIRRWLLPRPGQGPDRAARESGRYEIALAGRGADGAVLRASVRGERDPGYGSTSRLVAHSALALLHEVDRAMTPGGVWTPGAAFGLRLVERLQAHAGLRFEVDEA